MRRYTGLVERLVSAAVGVLVAAVLLVLAVRLVEAVIMPLLLVIGSLLAGWGLFWVCRLVRRRRAGW